MDRNAPRSYSDLIKLISLLRTPPLMIATLPCNFPLQRCFSSLARGRGLHFIFPARLLSLMLRRLTFLLLKHWTLRALRVAKASQRRRVRAAFFAAVERDRAERCFATRFACFDNARFDAARRLSRLSARLVARERFEEGFLRRPARPFARSRFA